MGSFFFCLFTFREHFLFPNSYFVGKVALELGPAPDVAFFNSRGNRKVRAEIEKFTKRVAVRAVELSTGAFCTEFRYERLRDDGIFFLFLIHVGRGWPLGPSAEMLHFLNSRVNQRVHEKGRRESRGALDHCILHRILVRIQPCGRFFASSHMGKVYFSCFPVDFCFNSPPPQPLFL